DSIQELHISLGEDHFIKHVAGHAWWLWLSTTPAVLNMRSTTVELGKAVLYFMNSDKGVFRDYLQASVASSSLYPVYTLSLNWSENV
ncbi:Hypothetical protein FKW44_004688, partial [Caligus rogercresseyi]